MADDDGVDRRIHVHNGNGHRDGTRARRAVSIARLSDAPPQLHAICTISRTRHDGSLGLTTVGWGLQNDEQDVNSKP
ncbi:hypothetical protein ACC691_40840, partial [Rhizobium johnstonii]|uniref:hypothetical protein n=1 Tax=Rhizobium johnstonii TaxID=3019933 RepID=UPI003F99DC6A